MDSMSDKQGGALTPAEKTTGPRGALFSDAPRRAGAAAQAAAPASTSPPPPPSPSPSPRSAGRWARNSLAGRLRQLDLRLSPAARLFWFLLYGTVGVVMLAAALLLPEYSALRDLRHRRDALAAQIEVEGQLATYNDRLIKGLATDPELTARLMMRNGNCQPVTAKPYDVGNEMISPLVPPKLLRDAHTVPPLPAGRLYQWGKFLDDASTQASLTFLALGVLVTGTVLFGPQFRPRSPVATTAQA